MNKPLYSITITPDEEKIAQLLTRDAWTYFGNLISAREIFHIKDIPMMPRRGIFSVAPDEELVQYYLDFAHAYEAELALLGWNSQRASAAAEGFVAKLEDLSGQVRGKVSLQERAAS